MTRILLALCLLGFWTVGLSSPQSRVITSERSSFELTQLVGGLGVPWGLSFINESQLLITEREGQIKLLDTISRSVVTIKGGPTVLTDGQGGLLDVAVAPDFKTGDWIYFTFVRDKRGEGVTVLARAKLQDTTLVQWQDLLETRSATNTGYHFGSRIAFDEKGHVYFGVGDRGIRENSQELANHAGTVMRLRRDGAVPHDNPFQKNSGALPEIWSFGHRNPQGMAYDFTNKRLWLIEHGPRGGDEINLVLPGRNYGWPVVSFGKEYWGPVAVGEGTQREGMEDPVKQYTPSIAPGSLLYYSGNAFPAWRGNLFSGALKLKHINRVTLDAKGKPVSEERLLLDLDERIRALAVDHAGLMYFSTDTGKIFRMAPVTKR